MAQETSLGLQESWWSGMNSKSMQQSREANLVSIR